MRRIRRAFAGALLVAMICSAGAGAVILEPIGAATYSMPTYVASDPRDPDRLFITEKAGTIDVTTPGGTSLFLDLTAEAADSGEQGLFSIAFAPDFAQTGLFYVAYAAQGTGEQTLDEYREQPTAAATKATRRLVLAVESPISANHNGGQLQFGPDGYLYWSIGEDTTASNAQTLNNDLGKILRIDPRQSGLQSFTVPPTNPFAATGTKPEIWAFGLRNTWRFSFDRATGAIVIADVGASAFEEIDYATQASGGGVGANYGWPACEAHQGTNCSVAPLIPPIYAYDHTPAAANCAITGGYVVRDPDLGALFGRYLFADYCGGDLRSIDPTAPPAIDGDRDENLSAESPVSFGEDACGRIYVVSQGAAANAGRVFRLEGPGGGACTSPFAVPDAEPPETRLKLKRKQRHSRTKAILSSTEPDSTFECALDGRKWKSCEAKARLKRLDAGRHRFRARATDPAGNTDRTPAKKRFKIPRKD